MPSEDMSDQRFTNQRLIGVFNIEDVPGWVPVKCISSVAEVTDLVDASQRKAFFSFNDDNHVVVMIETLDNGIDRGTPADMRRLYIELCSGLRHLHWTFTAGN